MPNYETWIQSQLAMPVESHREYYRRRVSSRVSGVTKFSGKKTTPCTRGSRWVNYAIGYGDKRKPITVQGNTMRVDGQFRTDLDPNYVGNNLTAPMACDDVGRTSNVYCPNQPRGSTCSAGGPNWYNNSNKGGKLCQQSCFDAGYGYPGDDCSVGWTSSNFSNYSGYICRVVNDTVHGFVILRPYENCTGGKLPMPIPAVWVAPGSPEQVTETALQFREMRWDVKVLWDHLPELCALSASHVMKFDGKYYLFDSRMELLENTPDNPSRMWETDAQCNKVAPNFHNEDKCVLVPNCDAHAVGGGTFRLDRDALETFYAVGSKFVYSITGLRTSTAPCGGTSRWKRLDCGAAACAETPMATTSREALVSALEAGGGAANIADISVACYGVPAGAVLQLNATHGWQHVHRNEGGVYDFTEWRSAHPGGPEKITRWATGPFELIYPWHHQMDRWEYGSAPSRIHYVGDLDSTVEFESLPNSLKTAALAEALINGTVAMNHGYICGSPGEVANDPTLGHMLPMQTDFATRQTDMDFDYYDPFKPNEQYTQGAVWLTLAVHGADQLRQRVAWALSEIVVTSITGIGHHRKTEVWTNTYDIYVRNALGNYREILWEMSFGHIMGMFLTFLNSRSFDARGVHPDENYAREIMQLFSIGLTKLNPDGSDVLDSEGEAVPTYTNEHIQSFARVFTGITQRSPRTNVEAPDEPFNRYDPLKINPAYHDVYPKHDLDGNFLGDGYPLCSGMPADLAHRKGAKYKFVSEDYTGLDVVVLNTSSPLFRALCGSDASWACNLRFKVELNETVACFGAECDVEELRVVRVGRAYYRHIRPACVNLFFFNGMTTAMGHTHDHGMSCKDPDLLIAGTGCCGGCSDNPNPWLIQNNKNCSYIVRIGQARKMCTQSHWRGLNYCEQTCFDTGNGHPGSNCSSGLPYTALRICGYNKEYVRYRTAQQRCAARGLEVCKRRTGDSCGYGRTEKVWHPEPCTTVVKVRPDGTVSARYGGSSGQNVLYVQWRDDHYPRFILDGANGTNGTCPQNCTVTDEDACDCDVTVVDELGFSGVPSGADLLQRLKIRAQPPTTGCTGACDQEVQVYSANGQIDASTVFAYNGLYYENRVSMVSAGGGLFRNPPVFMTREGKKERDAMAEVGALMDYLVNHSNTPVFIGRQLIQKLVSSNPSGSYIQAVGEAFRTGRFNGTVYSGVRGDLAATVAAVLLHPEARGEDGRGATAFSGRLREPLEKIVHLLRSLVYKEQESFRDRPLIMVQTIDVIGQHPYSAPSVFNFFHHNYVPPFFPNDKWGPEFEIFTTPNIVGFFNGLHAMINTGMDGCGGLGHRARACGFNGHFTHPPASGSCSDMVAQLDLLLTGGRLGQGNKLGNLTSICESASGNDGLKAAERALVMTPEFNCFGSPMPQGQRQWPNPPAATEPRSYRAFVSLFLQGGADTFNLLVPLNSGCSLYDEYKERRSNMALPLGQLLTIDTVGQVCGQFGIHQRLPELQKLYNDGELAFVSNIGALRAPIPRGQHKGALKCPRLFSHSDQQNAAMNLKCQTLGHAQGTGGRMADVLASGPHQYRASTYSTWGLSLWAQGEQTTQGILSPYGARRFSGYASKRETVYNLTSMQDGNAYFEGFNVNLNRSLDSAQVLYEQYSQADVGTGFPGGNLLCQQLKVVAGMISVRELRKVERDFYYVPFGGFDTHSDMQGITADLFGVVNTCIRAFVTEMKRQGVWNNVVMASMSDFGRTLTSNGQGTDHAWSGHHFVLGGSVRGGKVLGKYHDTLAAKGAYDIGRGRMVPEFPWEYMMKPIGDWMGVEASQVAEVFPNIGNFNMSTHIMDQSTLFNV